MTWREKTMAVMSQRPFYYYKCTLCSSFNIFCQQLSQLSEAEYDKALILQCVLNITFCQALKFCTCVYEHEVIHKILKSMICSDILILIQLCFWTLSINLFLFRIQHFRDWILPVFRWKLFSWAQSIDLIWI